MYYPFLHLRNYVITYLVITFTYFDLVSSLNLIRFYQQCSLYVKETNEAIKFRWSNYSNSSYSSISIAYQKFICAFAIPPITCNNPGPETHNTTAGFPIEEKFRKDVLFNLSFPQIINLSSTFNSTDNFNRKI